MGTIAAYVAGGLGLVYGAWSSYLLHRWARECRNTRIAIAYKRKVKIDAPLVEWMLWARMAKKDREGRTRGPGRMVFNGGGASVLIVQGPRKGTVWKMKLDRWLGRSEPAARPKVAVTDDPGTG